MMSFVISHIVFMYHNLTESNFNEISLNKRALWTEENSKKFLVKYLIIGLIFLCFILICWGINIPSFVADFRGATGWALMVTGQPTKKYVTLIDIGKMLYKSSMNLHIISLSFVQIFFWTVAIVLPLIQLLLLLYIWLVPMTLISRQKMAIVISMINTWTCLEVVVTSVIVFVLEVREYIAFVVGHRCDFINKLLTIYFYDELDGITKCIDVIASLETGTFVLIVAVVIHFGIVSFVLRRCYCSNDNNNKRLIVNS